MKYCLLRKKEKEAIMQIFMLDDFRSGLWIMWAGNWWETFLFFFFPHLNPRTTFYFKVVREDFMN